MSLKADVEMRTAQTVNRRPVTSSIRLTVLSVFFPRIWKIMIVVAYPFFLLAAKYFEALESTGTLGAFVADTLFPATLIAYVALIFILKKRAI